MLMRVREQLTVSPWVKRQDKALYGLQSSWKSSNNYSPGSKKGSCWVIGSYHVHFYLHVSKFHIPTCGIKYVPVFPTRVYQVFDWVYRHPGWAYRIYPSVGYRYWGRTEVLGSGIEVISNLPQRRYRNRALTEPYNHTGVFGKVLRPYRTTSG